MLVVVGLLYLPADVWGVIEWLSERQVTDWAANLPSSAWFSPLLVFIGVAVFATLVVVDRRGSTSRQHLDPDDVSPDGLATFTVPDLKRRVPTEHIGYHEGEKQAEEAAARAPEHGGYGVPEEFTWTNMDAVDRTRTYLQGFLLELAQLGDRWSRGVFCWVEAPGGAVFRSVELPVKKKMVRVIFPDDFDAPSVKDGIYSVTWRGAADDDPVVIATRDLTIRRVVLTDFWKGHKRGNLLVLEESVARQAIESGNARYLDDYGFSITKWNNMPNFECNDCNFSSLELERIEQHRVHNHKTTGTNSSMAGLSNWEAGHWELDVERDVGWSLPTSDGTGIILALKSTDGEKRRVYFCRVTDSEGNDVGTHDSVRAGTGIFGEGHMRTTIEAVDELTLAYPVATAFPNAPVSIPDGRYYVEWRAVSGVGSELVQRDTFEIRNGHLVSTINE